MTRWLIYGILAALGVAVALVVAVAIKEQEPIIGPTPEEIEEHCQPVIDWILSETEKSGRPPQQISSEHAARLDELPYSWSLQGSFLSIGRPDDEWPAPLYSYQWSAGGWWGRDVLPDGVTRRGQVEEHCRPVVEWIQSEMDGSQPLPEQLPDEHTAKLNELPYRWSYDHLGLRISDAAAEPQYSYFWSPRQWSWWADYGVSDEEARRILEDHGYYR